MGLNFIPKYPEISSCEPATTSVESIDDLFPQDGALGEGETPGWWILGLAICVLPWILAIALISVL